MSKPVKPVLFPDSRTDAEKFDPRLHMGALDPSRIPGYSEIVQANDVAKSDPLVFRNQTGMTHEDMFKKIGAKPQELPVEFKWLRISGPGGADSHSAMRTLDTAKNKEGFRLASEEDLERYGYSFPPAGRKAEDGTIRRGADTALFIRSGEVARMWERYIVEEAARLEGASVPATLTEGGYSAETFVEEEREKAEVTH